MNNLSSLQRPTPSVYDMPFSYFQTDDDVGDFEAFCDSLSWEDHADAMAATLVVPPDACRMNYPILKCDRSCDDDGWQRLRGPGPPDGGTSRFPRAANAPSYGASPLPVLEGWIVRTLGRRGGLVGSVGTWSLGTGGSEYFVGPHPPLPRTVRFNMKGNRFCDNVRRAHKSNNITWNVNLVDRVCWQGCHDPECEGYRGEPIDLPEDVNAEIDEFFLEHELSSLNEDDVVVKRDDQQTVQHDDSHGEFDDALLEADMRQIDLSRICQERDSAKASSSSICAMSEPCSGTLMSRNVDVKTSCVKSECSTPSKESLLNEDAGVGKKDDQQTAHYGDGEFDDVLLENVMRHLDLSNIFQEKDSVKASLSGICATGEPCSGPRSGIVDVITPHMKSESSVERVSSIKSTPSMDNDDLDLELARLNLSDAIVRSKA